MRSFLVFLKKEFVEQVKTYKAIILLAVFLIFGMMSPLLAKLTPEIFKSMKMEGMQFTIPDPTFIDAYGQFFKNLSQMGFIVILLVFSGMISQEISRGTLINILSKGLSRTSVVLSKFVAAVTTWTVCYVISVLTCFGYTFYLFGSHSPSNFFLSLFTMWLFGIFVLALITLCSAVVSGNYGGLLLSGGVLGILLILGAFPNIVRFNPTFLASCNTGLLSNTADKGDVFTAMFVTVIAIVLCLVLAVLSFNKKKL